MKKGTGKKRKGEKKQEYNSKGIKGRKRREGGKERCREIDKRNRDKSGNKRGERDRG